MKISFACIIFLLSGLMSCKPHQTETAPEDAQVSSVYKGEASDWKIERKLLAMSNNIGKALASCSTGAAVVALTLFAETIPVLSLTTKFTPDTVETIVEISDSRNQYYGVTGGGALSLIRDVGGNIINLLKRFTIRDYRLPGWSHSWDALRGAYAGSFNTIQTYLAGENAVCRDSLVSFYNVSMTFFPKKNGN